MGSLIRPELGLDCRFSPKPYVQRPIGRLLAEASKIHSESDRIGKLGDYANRLRDEMKKIDAFKRELPLCMLLITDAIVAVQEELAECKKANSEPVLEEFMPLKRIEIDDDKVEGDGKEKEEMDELPVELQLQLNCNSVDHRTSDSNTDYSNKKSSTNLDNDKKKKIMGEEINQVVMDDVYANGKNRGFVPFKGSPNFSVMDELPAPGLSLCTPGVKNPSREVINPIASSYSRSGSSPPTTNLQPSFKTAAQLQTSRKQRRCWSPELHRQFINALQHLGGPQAATPKQIREHMQVDGLTNDEVKSHLQKYRLHMRRVASNSTSQNAGSWTPQELFAESLKQSNGQSRSPEGPLQLSRCEDEDDE